MFKNQWQKFKQQKLSYYSLIIFLIIFIITTLSSLIANDKPLLVKFQDKFYFPLWQAIPETTFGGSFYTTTNYLDPAIKNLIEKQGWLIMPPIPYSFDTLSLSNMQPSPAKPSSQNWLGTDDWGRDVLARLLYGTKISLSFALLLSFLSLIVAIILGAVQGYFAGWVDLLLQRFSEIWSSLPVMFLLILFSAFITPGFYSLLFILLSFNWLSMVGFIRLEFLKLKQYNFVRSSVALGASPLRIIFYHILPNALPIILANLPFLIASSLTTLTALDFMGFGLPVGTPSLGELLAQGKNNLKAYWLGICGFVATTTILALLVFIGEGINTTNNPYE
jgi:microcin C transport system permease protein